MKDPDKKSPNVPELMLLSMFPIILLILGILCPLTACWGAGLVLNYSFLYWLIGIGFVSLYLILCKLAHIGMTYVWEYRALVFYLRKRGLEKFIQEAKEIKDLRQ